MGLKQSLMKEREKLNYLIDEATKTLAEAPEGALHVKFANKKKTYFCYINREIHFLAKTRQENLIRALAQKRYATKVLKVAYKQRKALDRFLCEYDFQALSAALEDFKTEGMITPYLSPSDEESEETPSIDYGLIKQLKDLCSKILA